MKFGPTPQNTWDVTPAEVSLIRPVLLPRPASIPALVHRLYGFTATSGDPIRGLTDSSEVRQAQTS
ncbi:MAG TPA: hypothetical protein VFL49_05090 [Pseudolabrys sp.]|nr:hypothetical protein [Pseudolabrys sp.]